MLANIKHFHHFVTLLLVCVRVCVWLPGVLSAAPCVCTCNLLIWRHTPFYRSWAWTCTPSSCCPRSLSCLHPSPPSPETHSHADTYGSAAGFCRNDKPIIMKYLPLWTSLLHENRLNAEDEKVRGQASQTHLGRNTGFWDRWSLRSGDVKSADRYRIT